MLEMATTTAVDNDPFNRFNEHGTVHFRGWISNDKGETVFITCSVKNVPERLRHALRQPLIRMQSEQLKLGNIIKELIDNE